MNYLVTLAVYTDELGEIDGTLVADSDFVNVLKNKEFKHNIQVDTSGNIVVEVTNDNLSIEQISVGVMGTLGVYGRDVSGFYWFIHDIHDKLVGDTFYKENVVKKDV